MIGSDRKKIPADGKTIGVARKAIHMAQKRNCAATDIDQTESIRIVIGIRMEKEN